MAHSSLFFKGNLNVTKNKWKSEMAHISYQGWDRKVVFLHISAHIHIIKDFIQPSNPFLFSSYPYSTYLNVGMYSMFISLKSKKNCLSQVMWPFLFSPLFLLWLPCSLSGKISNPFYSEYLMTYSTSSWPCQFYGVRSYNARSCSLCPWRISWLHPSGFSSNTRLGCLQNMLVVVDWLSLE